MKKILIGILLLCLFFSIGILLARHKPLWNDELYGQQVTVQGTSWPDIILGHSVEWNSFPLFQAMQKLLLQTLHYQLPFVWHGESHLVSPQAQLVLRILPDMLMSAALTAIVLFFGLRSGFVSGVTALFITFSMPMVWLYWVEARSYSLWFALTVFQSLLFLDTVSKENKEAPMIPFVLVHAGLCLTAPLGVIQTIVAEGLLWLVGARQVKFFMITGLVPVFLGAYYIIGGHRMSMFLFASWQQIFLRNFPQEQIIFLLTYVLLMFLSFGKKEYFKYFLFGRAFLPFCFVFIVLALAGLFWAGLKSVPQSAPVVERHFIYLTPVGIIMTAAIIADGWNATAKSPWWRMGLMIIFMLGLLGQLLSAFELVSHFYVYF